MRNVSSNLKDCGTLCWVWRLSLKDGSQLGFTDHDKVLTFQGLICEPQSGFAGADTDSRMGFAADVGTAIGLLDSDRITADDIKAGRFDNAAIETFRVNWKDASEYVAMSRGTLGEIRQKGASFEAEWRGPAHVLERSTGRVFSKQCDAEFGDSRCGINLADYPDGTTCPRSFAACRDQFSNVMNFRGFPYLIGDDVLTAGLVEGEIRDGGSRYR